MSLDLTDDKSTLVQVMAWCHQATSHYLSQCWPRSLSYGITRPQWINVWRLGDAYLHQQTRSPKVQIMAWQLFVLSEYISSINWYIHSKRSLLAYFTWLSLLQIVSTIYVNPGLYQMLSQSTYLLTYLNTLRLRQNGCHFADNIFKGISWMKIYEFWLKFLWSLFLCVQLTIFQPGWRQAIIWTNDG